jgi:hypothetical protein
MWLLSRGIGSKDPARPSAREAGPLFEQYAGLELLRAIRQSGRALGLRFWRDPDGPEVDRIVEGEHTLLPVEVKWSDAPSNPDARHLRMVCTSHTTLMKVAVSVPDTVFQAAERVSRRMRVSRSRLYAQAVEAYVKQHSGADITEQLNKVYAGNSSTLDPALEAASLEVLRRGQWE